VVEKGDFMKANKIWVATALAAVVSVGINANAVAKLPPMEKCAGIVKAGKNDCGSGVNGCAGQDKADRSRSGWIYVPKGTCDKIVGGRVVRDEKKTS
jgi:uncharacterized membrane protein